MIGNILKLVDKRRFKAFADKYSGDYYIKHFNCWAQFVSILIGQISNCRSLREIQNFINFQPEKQYHLGIKKNTNLSEMIKIIDSSPIPLNLNQHKWAEETLRIKGIKLHVIYDLKQEIPTFFDFSGAKTNDIEMGKTIDIQKNTTYVFDRAYMDFNWWNEINTAGAFFVTRFKKNNAYIEITELQATNDIISSQTINLKSKYSKKAKNKYYEKPLRRIEVKRDGKEPLVLVTNDFKRSDEEIAELYKQRWQIELFFKWIKQNLKIKKFLGRSENAIKTQICIALISYLLLKVVSEAKEIWEKLPLKDIVILIKNNLFRSLLPLNGGRRRHKDPNQLQFELLIPT